MTSAADLDVAALDVGDLIRFSLARSELRNDPTPANPRVTDASGIAGYRPGLFVMLSEGLAIEYRFLDETRLALLSVRARPLLPERAG